MIDKKIKITEEFHTNNKVFIFEYEADYKGPSFYLKFDAIPGFTESLMFDDYIKDVVQLFKIEMEKQMKKNESYIRHRS